MSIVDLSDLESAITISLYSKRGACWGEALTQIPFGSDLWKLLREPPTGETLQRAETYAEEALKWLRDAGHDCKANAAFNNGRVNLNIDVKGKSLQHGI